MNEKHEANRRYWDQSAAAWRELRNRDELWKKCPHHPELAFEGETFEEIRRFFPDLRKRRVCVIGSGDNYATFALAGCGAEVTSVDISELQLSVAKDRAEQLGVNIEFIRADATDLRALTKSSYDLVVSTNGFFVWISEPEKLFAAIYGILRQQGLYIFYDIHPFLRPWANKSPLNMAKPYGDRGPYAYDDGGRSYEFHWTLGDLLNGLAAAGLVLKSLRETGANNPRFWQDFSYEPGSANDLLDWRENPRAGLPAWLTVAAQKA